MDLIRDGLLQVKPFDYFKNIPENDIKLFMVEHGIYVMPTQELIEWLMDNIIGSAIEIGAGVGSIGRALGIPITDNKMQQWPMIKMMYEMMHQKPIEYPEDVEELDYADAVIKYRPETVIGGFITHKWLPGMDQGNEHGVREEFLLNNTKRYIMIGNRITHAAKPILKRDHLELYFPWLVTRGMDQSQNRIFVWDSKI